MSDTTEIKLLSTMGKRFGRSHRVHLDTKTTAEAVRWLLAVFPGAREYLSDAHKRGITFAVFRGRGQMRENISLEQLAEPAGDCITFAPVMAGAKSGGILQTILGVTLIVAASIATGGIASAFAAGAGVWGTVASVGVAMTLGGVAQMLSPQPKVSTNADSSSNQGSYVFSGAVNTTAQGNPVPRGYGRMIIGSAVISAGITAADYVPSSDGVGTGTVNGSLVKSPYETPA